MCDYDLRGIEDQSICSECGFEWNPRFITLPYWGTVGAGWGKGRRGLGLLIWLVVFAVLLFVHLLLRVFFVALPSWLAVIVIFVLQPALGMENVIADSTIGSFFLDTTPVVRALLPAEFDSAIREFS